MKITQQQYDDAARAVLIALRQRRATTNRRLHVDRYKKHAAPVLGMSSVYPGRWAEVLDAGRRLGLFKIDRNTLSKPVFVDLGAEVRPSSYTPAESHTDPAPALSQPEPVPVVVEDTDDEDTSDDPTVTEAARVQAPTSTEHTHGIVLVRGVSGGWLAIGEERKIGDERLDEEFARWSVHSETVIAFFTEPAR